MAGKRYAKEAKEDQKALYRLARAIIKNKRLAWLIVEIWLDKNGYLLTAKDGDR